MVYVVFAGRYSVSAFTEERDLTLVCPTLQFLKEQHATVPGHVRGMKALFERYAKGGRTKLTIDLLHHADYNDDIYEFIKGDLRVFSFFDETSIILTNGGLKKGKKANPHDVAEAVRCKNLYFKWKNGNHGR